MTHAIVVILDAPDYPFSEAACPGLSRRHSPKVFLTRRLSDVFPAGVDQNASQTAIAKLLSAGQRVDAIFSVTDSGAYGAIAALAQRRLTARRSHHCQCQC